MHFLKVFIFKTTCSFILGQCNSINTLAKLQEIQLVLLFNACQRGKGDCYPWQTLNSKIAGSIQHSAF